ncbi:hypothetical protein LINGRAHAP2_LOCUS27969 [Linum grandiflorum]
MLWRVREGTFRPTLCSSELETPFWSFKRQRRNLGSEQMRATEKKSCSSWKLDEEGRKVSVEFSKREGGGRPPSVLGSEKKSSSSDRRRIEEEEALPVSVARGGTSGRQTTTTQLMEESEKRIRKFSGRRASFQEVWASRDSGRARRQRLQLARVGG